MKRKLGAEGAWPIVGCIGRLSEQKAQHYLVEAVALLTGKYPQIKLLLAGEGELRPFLQKRIQDLGLSSHVFLLGERDDIADLLTVFDVYAMSSRWEGVGRALTEAMYTGLPVAATSVNGVTELISHEETGLLAPPDNHRALATAIDRLASDRELAKRLGSNARQRTRELMDGQRMIMAIEELYGKLAATQEFAGTTRSYQGI
jgi:glycosyltransferase involved in cell wall biosynthesis